MSLAATPNADVAAGGVFGQTMGLVAATLGFLTLGAYLGRHLGGGASILFFLLGFFCLIALNHVRGAGGAAAGLLFATGLFLGLGLAGGLAAYASASPDAVWQSAAATALFVGGLGALGYGIQSDLSGGYRLLFFLLLGLIIYGLVTLFVSMPAGDVIYAVLGLVIFGGYTVLDFNRLRRADGGDAPSIAAGIFLDVLNVFTFFLQLFGRGRD
jgi:FtsH-binding integral membrane protein